MAKREDAGHMLQADGGAGSPVYPQQFTEGQLWLINLISSRFCGKFRKTVGHHCRTRVDARLVGAEPLPFWIVLNCLPFGYSTALARCQPSAECCLIEAGRELLKPFCGEETRTYELGKASAAAETHPEGFYVAPAAERNATRRLTSRRVVHVIKNGERTLDLVAVGIESIIPVALYSLLLKAWKWAWAEIPLEFEILGYDHDFYLLEQVMPPLTPMVTFILEVQIDHSLGIISVSVPGSILNSEKRVAKKLGSLGLGPAA